MNIAQLIYDIIVTYYIKGHRVFDSTLYTNLRGSIGPVSEQFKEYYFFGADKDIGGHSITKRLDYLINKGYIKCQIREIDNLSRKCYIPSDSNQAINRYLKISRGNKELKKDLY